TGVASTSTTVTGIRPGNETARCLVSSINYLLASEHESRQYREVRTELHAAARPRLATGDVLHALRQLRAGTNLRRDPASQGHRGQSARQVRGRRGLPQCKQA